MSKKLNLIALMILLIGQIILGPMGSWNFAYADEGDGQEVVETPAPAEEPAPPAEEPAPPDPGTPDPGTPDPGTPDPGTPDPSPTDPVPTDPLPTDPTPTDPTPTDPVPTDPLPTDPTPTDPAPTEPTPTDPVPTDSPSVNALTADPPPVDCEDPDAGPGKSDCRHVYVTKIDPTGEPIPGIRFTTTRDNNKWSRTGVTDSDGKVTLEFAHNGNTYLTEADGDYKLCRVLEDGTDLVSFKKQKNGEDGIVFQDNKDKHYTFVNAPTGMDCDSNIVKAELEVTKKFRDSNSNTLKGTFTLTGPNNYFETKTMKNGNIEKFSNLKPGEYTLTEISSTDEQNYALMEPWTFTVTSDGKINGDKKHKTTIWNEKIQKAELEVTKKFRDSNSNSLKGTFTLTGPNNYSETKTITNEKNGKFSNLKPGEYTLTEISSTDEQNYALIEPWAFTVTSDGKINGDKKHKTTIWNEKIQKAELEVTKKFRDSNSNSLKGTFTLTGPNNYSETKTITNEKNGKFSNLKPGEYTLTEISSTDEQNYALMNPRTFIVTSEGKINGDKKHKITVWNEKKTEIPKSELTIQKFFEESEDGELEAEFTLTGPEGFEPITFTITNMGSKIFMDLEDGVYTLTEDSTDDDYEVTNSRTFNIEDGKFVFNGEPGTNEHTETITNYKKTEDPKGKLIITKVDSQFSWLHLNGAKFELYHEENLDTPIATQATKWQGFSTGIAAIFDNLEYGTYILKEIKAPDGYEISEEYANGVEIEIDSEVIWRTVENTREAAVTLIKKKEGTNETLQGAKFKLQQRFPFVGWQDVRGYSNLETDENGQINIPLSLRLLPEVDYRFVETEAPEGYEIGDTKEYPFKIKNLKEPITIQAYNAPIIKPTGTVTIVKYEEGNEQETLPGAVFALYKKNAVDADYTRIRESEEFRTGAGGILEVSGLESGEYYFEETAAPMGYALDNETRYSFEVGLDGDQIYVTPDRILVPNEPEPTGSITLYKHRAGSIGTPLNGVTFSLYKVEGDEPAVLVEAGLVTSGTGSEAGHLVVEDLPYGDYYFIETETIAGYQLDNTTKYGFTIPYAPLAIMIAAEGDQEDVGNDVETIFVPNTPISTPPGPGPGPDPEPGTGSVTLIKTDVTTSEGLGEAVFSLYRVGETNPIQTGLTTDTAGNLTVNNLKPGDYYFVETTAPTGYVLDATTQHTFAITASQLASVEVTNTKFTGSVTLFKKDSETDEGLSGAVFSLYQAGEDEAIQTGLTTNAAGNLTVNDLVAGDYYFVEIAAPEGYVLDGTPRPFTISSTQTANVQVEVANTTISDTTGSVTLYKVNSDTGEALNGATFAIYRVVDGEEDALVLGGLITGGVGQPDGYISASDLPIGSYYIIETAAPEGYELGDTPPRIDFAITAGMTAVLDLGTVANTPETTGGGGGGGGGGGSGGGPTPTPVTPTPSPETPNEEVEETPQPESPNEEVEETPLPESPNVPVEEMPQPEAPIIVEEQPQPEAPSVTVEKPSKPESTSVTVKELPRPQATKVSPTLPRTGEEMPIATLIGGLALITLGGWLLLGRRKRNKTQM